MLIFTVSASGHGRFVPAYALLGIAAGIAIAAFAKEPGRGVGTVGPWPFAAGFALAAALTLLLGLWLNRASARRRADLRTGSEDVAPAPHRFCGWRMEWWSIPMLALAALLLASPDEPERRPRGPGTAVPAGVIPKD